MSALLALAASGLLYYLSTNLGTYWPLAWIAPAPVLWYALGRQRPLRTMLVAFAAFIAGELNLVPVYWTVVPVPVLILALLIPAAAFALVVWMTGRLGPSLPAPVSVFLFPALWTTWEYLFSLVSPNGTFLSVAYSQVPFLTLIQVASFAGWPAITFLVSLFPSALAIAIRSKPLRLSPILVPMAVLTLALGFGIASLLRGGKATSRIRVGLVARGENRSAYGTRDRSVAINAAGGYGDAVERLAQSGAELVLAPEACITVRPEWQADMREFFADLARRTRVQVVIGFDEYLADGTHQNAAYVISRSGDFIGKYIKHRHLPGQDYQVGTEILQMPGRIGVSICKDLDFPALGRRYSRAGTGLLLVPAWDFGKDGRLHAQMAWMRGVEGGYSLARCAEQGLLSVTDSKGAPVAISESRSGSEVLLTATVRAGPANTIYARTGDLFALACLAAAAAMVVAAVIVRSTRQAGSDHDRVEQAQ